MKTNIANLDIKSRKRIFSNLLGEHNSVFSGNGLDFKELRQYSSGDDIRHINWKVTARTNTPSINIYNEDKQLNVVLVYLNSGSIYFGSKRAKKDVMLEIFAMLGYSTVNKKDTLTSLIFSSKEENFYTPTKHKAIVDIVLDEASSINSLGKEINYNSLSSYLLAKIKKKSLIFIIGDFLDLPDFRYLGAKHEVYCAIVRDRFEEDLKIAGEFNFVDTNKQDMQNIFLDDKSINQYNALMKAHDDELSIRFKSSNIRYKKIYTSDNVMLKLKQLVR